MIFRAYAKLNLLLRVTGRRPDGYHDLFTVVHTVSLWDRIALEPSDDPGIQLTVDDPGLPSDERNLAYRAAELYYARLGWEPHLRIDLRKRIPERAGLGGGSSDAAAVLTGLDAMHGHPMEERELSAIAMSLGSDVPFFVRGGCALVEGRGERITPLPSLRDLHAVLLSPEFGIETAQAYRLVEPSGEVPGEIRSAILREPGSTSALLPYLDLGNDLGRAVSRFYPALPALERALLDAGATAATVTGSGSTVFGLYPTADAARRASETLGGDARHRVSVVRGVDPTAAPEASEGDG